MSTESRKRLFTAERRMKDTGDLPAAGGGGVDTQLILDAIMELKAAVEQSASSTEGIQKIAEDMPELAVLRGQLFELRDSIDKTKKEIAAVRAPGERDDRLTSAAMELDAIVSATENATHNILNATEDIEDKVQELKERIGGDVGAGKLLDDISNLGINILENCNFQDITGQRTSKVVKTIHYLEDRISTMIGIWGAEEFAGLARQEEEKSGDHIEGPQLEGKGVSQDDIDALFD